MRRGNFCAFLLVLVSVIYGYAFLVVNLLVFWAHSWRISVVTMINNHDNKITHTKKLISTLRHELKSSRIINFDLTSSLTGSYLTKQHKHRRRRLGTSLSLLASILEMQALTLDQLTHLNLVKQSHTWLYWA